MTNRLAALFADRRGAVTMELALLAPMLGALLIGMIEMSQAMSKRTTLEQAVQRGIEMVQQGKGNTTNSAAIQSDVAAAAGINASAVTVNWYVDCVGGADKLRAITFNCPAGTVAARYVRIVATSRYAPIFGTPFAGTRNTDGSYVLSAQNSVRIQ